MNKPDPLDSIASKLALELFDDDSFDPYPNPMVKLTLKTGLDKFGDGRWCNERLTR